MKFHFRNRVSCLLLAFLATAIASSTIVPASEPDEGWVPLFDGRTLTGWRASEHNRTWRVEDGCLVAHGQRSHLFYEGPVGEHDFRDFELRAEVRTEADCNAGIYFHTQYQQSGWPKAGYEVQINNTYTGVAKYRELKRTGSLYAVRNIYRPCVRDGEWFHVRVRVTGNRICIWVNGQPTVDYVQPEQPSRKPDRTERVLSHGTLALQGHDAGSRVAFRQLQIRQLPGGVGHALDDRPSDEGYGVKENLMDRLAGESIPVIDFHVHLRGGMTIDKAVQRQAVTGINIGVLRNLGQGWPLETDDQLREFLDSVQGRPVFVGLQVNDRDWMDKHSPDLLQRLDFVLADTMIMPMPDDDSEPVKLWLGDQYTIDDPEAWMERYMRHNLRVLAEPVTILANPTYLPAAVEKMYDQLWTDERMRQIVQAAIANDVALEINARSGLPHDRFIRMAKEMGAKFSFGSNNFDDRPIDMSRCFEAIGRYGLTKADMVVPAPKR